MATYKIDGALFKVSKLLAERDFNRWEKINANRKEKQCFNTFNSCFIGVLAERAAQFYLEEYKAKHIKDLIMYGIEERKQGKHFGLGDIVLSDYLGKNYKIECKGITKGQQRGQITVYHLNKYLKEKVALVLFVEVEYNLKFAVANCEVYLEAKPNEIKKWGLRPNKYKVECFTYEKGEKND